MPFPYDVDEHGFAPVTSVYCFCVTSNIPQYNDFVSVTTDSPPIIKEPGPIKCLDDILIRDPDKSKWESFCGKYQHPEDFDLIIDEVYLKDGELHAKAIDDDGDDLEFQLYPIIGEDKFGRKGGTLELTFGDGCVKYGGFTCQKL